jgi:hypothetical protein
MTQADLDRAVARATGESVAAIRRRGFQLEDSMAADDDEPQDDAVTAREGPLVLDWDDYAAVPLEGYLDAA